MPKRQNKDINESKLSGMGEEKAFEYFFRQYYPALTFFANSIIHNEDEAKDIVQDCFIILWASQSISERSATVKTFLYTAVRNKCVDYLRKQKTIQRAAAVLSMSGEELTFDHSEEVAFAEMIRELGDEIDKLPFKVKDIFQLYFVEGKKHREIAAAIHSTPGAVRKQKERALKVIKGKLDLLLLLISSCLFFW
jgi:RNA polymerase sigma-70 factor (family 1)